MERYFENGKVCPKCGSPIYELESDVSTINEQWCSNQNCNFAVNDVEDNSELAQKNNISEEEIEKFFRRAN